MAPYRNRDSAAVKLDRRLRSLEVKMAGRDERKVLRKMIVLFKDMPHLWNKTHVGYQRQQSVKDFEALLKVYCEFDPLATLTTVRAKLNALVSSYVDELKRVRLARLFHPDEPHMHRPWLWHYHDFHFMASSISISSLHLQNIKSDGTLDKIGLNVSQATSTASNTIRREKSSCYHQTESTPHVFLKQKINAVYEPNKVEKQEESQEYKVNREQASKGDVASFVEAQLQSVDEGQKKIALKLISDTLENARLGKLRIDTNSQLGENSNGDKKSD